LAHKQNTIGEITMKYGDRIKAREGSVDAIFSEGRTGTIKELAGNGGVNNLVEWDGYGIIMGFHLDQVDVVQDSHQE